jgi:uncharacterized protein (TIGR03086 family)
MDTRIDSLEAMFAHTAGVIQQAANADLSLSTPCDEFSVGQLLSHISVWVQVFETAVTNGTLPFDPMTHTVDSDWHRVFTTSASGIVNGLRADGFEREMSMTGAPLAGEFILNMLLMEYLAHGWDLCKAMGIPVPHSSDLASVSLDAAKAILAPEYRGTGMFGYEVSVPDDASAMDRFVAFIGRDPGWAR